ncbi:DUF6880 family protein [Humitalea sp. 24SJ18S-53]|uniref:DUF6880 family protein n=1 Tax=Humitalea sp. 24SJ18S-53 TaxID=3422307 RepID=UPI003D678C99
MILSMPAKPQSRRKQNTMAPSAPPTKAPSRASPRLTASALEQLGAARLAAFLIAQAEGDPVLARSLRLELAGADSTTRLAAEVDKRLRTIQRSRSLVDWAKVRPLAREIDSLREAVAGPLAAASPRMAAEQMRRLLELAGGIFERSDDGSGTLGEAFRTVGAALGQVWSQLPDRKPADLARELLAILDADGYGAADRLLEAASPALGPDGRSELRRLLLIRLAASPPMRSASGYDTSPDRREALRHLRDLADLDGDVDAFIVAIEALDHPEFFAGEVAERLLKHQRPAEALAWLDRAPDRLADKALRLADLRIAALDTLGRKEEAHTLRWATFCRWLSAPHLKAHLRTLTGFDDVEAEQRALDHALGHADRNLALAFLVAWPDLTAANRLVQAQVGAMDPRDYHRLRPAAEALAERYPAAAALLHRALAEDVLRRAASKNYPYAARDVQSCARLADRLPDEESFESHAAFVARLRREHPRKSGFWTLVPAG